MTTHRCPPRGSGIMPCCGRAPLEVPSTDRMTLEASLVTCTQPTPTTHATGERPMTGSSYRMTARFVADDGEFDMRGEEVHVKAIARALRVSHEFYDVAVTEIVNEPVQF